MSKLPLVSLLALGVVSAMPTTASAVTGTGVEGASIYIADPGAAITFTFGDFSNPGVSYSQNSNVVFFWVLDKDGNALDSVRLFSTQGSANNIATLIPNSTSLTPVTDSPYTFSYTPSADAYQLAFTWQTTSPVSSSGFGSGTLKSSTGHYYDKTWFSDNNLAVMGLDNGGGAWSDVIFGMTNVSATPFASIPATPPVPEPETWAMLLAGLGIVSVMARRRSA